MNAELDAHFYPPFYGAGVGLLITAHAGAVTFIKKNKK